MSKKINMGEAAKFFSSMIGGNQKHAETHSGIYRGLKEGQSPKVAITFCSDSRLQGCMFGDSISLVGNLFAGRDIGNGFEDSEGAIDYAIRHLGVPILFIMGHTECGALKAARGDYSGETDAIRSRIDRLCVHEKDEVSPQKNVDMQVLRAMEKYIDEVRSGELAVIGGVFDLGGYYRGLEGKIYITNFNGVTDVQEIKKRLKGYVPAELSDGTVKRI